ncbi:hypothetical protein [Legionella sp. km772]|uniref:hypothetical protein n=1 Tax=Legionella sp. km772 TaxID=2498111 RepID=UPI000F8EAB7B|nr:hypothetical protein [Legionella sp. km772]RUR06982.1 hypothetical protein ELY15_12660 [Legionella sp. km772]
MLNQYFQQKNMNPFAHSLETPVKELMDLNMRAMQSFSYLMPNEFLSMRRPEEMMEKNLEVLIENSHTAIAYMQNIFNIMEKHWLKNFETSIKDTKDFGSLTKLGAHTTKTASSDSIKNAGKSSVAKTATSKTKSHSSKAKSVSAPSTAAKSISAKAKTASPQKSTASKSSSVSKKPVAKPTNSAASKPSSASMTHGAASEAKHGGTMLHHSSASSSQAKPTMNESDSHKKI